MTKRRTPDLIVYGVDEFRAAKIARLFRRDYPNSVGLKNFVDYYCPDEPTDPTVVVYRTKAGTIVVRGVG